MRTVYPPMRCSGRAKCRSAHLQPPILQQCPFLPLSRPHLRGTKFQKLVKEAQASDEFKKYEPFLLPSINRENHLFCALTCRVRGDGRLLFPPLASTSLEPLSALQLFKKDMDSLKRHIAGKPFQRAKARFMQDKQVREMRG